MTLDDFSGAADAFRRGRGVDREGFTERHVDYQYNEGLSDLHLGRHGEARLRFSQALALVDEASAAEAVTASATAEAASIRGVQELRRIDSANGEVGGEKAVQSIPAVQILSVLAVACMYEGDYNDALAFLLRALDVNTTVVDAGGNASSGGGGVDCGAYDDDGEEKVVGGLDEEGDEGSHDEKDEEDEEDDEDEDGVGVGEDGQDVEDGEDSEGACGSFQDGPRNAKSTTIDSSGGRNGSKAGGEGREGGEGGSGSEGGDLSVVFNLAVCNLRLGMLDEALTWFRRAATLAPYNKQADAAVAMLEARLEARVEATRPKAEPGRTIDDGGGSGGGSGGDGGGGGGFSGGCGGGGGGDTAGERLYDEGFGGINSSRVNASSGGTEDTEDTEDAEDDVRLRPSMNGDAVPAGMPRLATSTSSAPNGDASEEDDAEEDEEEDGEGGSAFAMFAKGGWGMDILPMDPVFLRRPSLHELKVGCSRHSSFGSRSIGASGAPGTSTGTPGGSRRNVVLTPNGSP